MRRRIFLSGGLGTVLAGCRSPSDAHGTLQRVSQGTLRVGVLEPVVLFRRREEARALRSIAQQLGARIELHQGEMDMLMQDLMRDRLDLIAGDVPIAWDGQSDMALTRPWGSTVYKGRMVPAAFGVRGGESAFLEAVNRALAEWRH